MKKGLSILLALVMVLSIFTLIPVSTSAEETDLAEISSVPYPDSLYVSQYWNYSCTLASATMMLRSRFYRSNNTAWSSITETGIRSVAWDEGGGLWYSFRYTNGSNYAQVSHVEVGGLSLSTLKSLLNSHPEGIEIYCRGIPHAVFITDYEGDTVYASDPDYYKNYGPGRRTLSSTYLGRVYGNQANILANINDYWYISSYSITPNITPKPTNPWINVSKSTIQPGESVSFTFGATGATSYSIGIDKNGSRIITEGVTSGKSYTFSDEGSYTAYITASNSYGSVDSSKVSFTVSYPYPSAPKFSIFDVTNDEDGIFSTLTVRWNETSNTTLYELRFCDFDTGELKYTLSYKYTTNIVYSGEIGQGHYRVTVRAINENLKHLSRWWTDGETKELFVSEGVPYTPVDFLVEPPHDNIKQTIFTWKSNTYNRSYKLSIYNVADQSLYKEIDQKSKNEYKVSLSMPNGYYYAELIAYNVSLHSQPLRQYFTVENSINLEYPAGLDTSKAYVKIGNDYYEVHKGEIITFNHYLNLECDIPVRELRYDLNYDSSGLSWKAVYLNEFNNLGEQLKSPYACMPSFKQYEEDDDNSWVDFKYFNYPKPMGDEEGYIGLSVINNYTEYGIFNNQNSLLATFNFEVIADEGIFEINPVFDTLVFGVNLRYRNYICYLDVINRAVLANKTPITIIPKPDPDSISLNNDDNKLLQMSIGEQHQFNATVLPSNADDTITWGSSNPKVVSVDSNGISTAIGTGIAVISATTVNCLEATCIVRVEEKPKIFLGDVDGDDEVTIIDATCIQRKLANIPTATFVEAAADADGDGGLTIIDATVIQRHLAQLPAPAGIGKPIT